MNSSIHEHYDDSMLIAYLSGTLDADSQAAVSRHLDECKGCTDRFVRICERDDDVQATSSSASSEGSAFRSRHRKNRILGISAQHDFTAPEAPRDAIYGYEILEEVHRGGQGSVYRALQKSTHRVVAIKLGIGGAFALASSRVRFEREIALISRLSHPNIVAIFDSGETEGRSYFVMDYVEGIALDDYALLNETPMDCIVKLLVKVSGAIHYAHQRGVIHRDLKPSNILVDVNGEPHIVDFGLGKSIGDGGYSGEPGRAVSIAGQIVGTLPYLSPEQAAGRLSDVGVRSDVYALGVILYQVIARQFPYIVVGHPDDVRAAIIARPPTPLRSALSQVDRYLPVGHRSLLVDLEAILFRALEKDPERRYQSAAALADDLTRCLAGEPVEARRYDRFYLLRKTLRAYRTQLLVATAALLLLLSSSIAVLVAWKRADALAQIYHRGLEIGSFMRAAATDRDRSRQQEALALLEKAIELSENALWSDSNTLELAFWAHFDLSSSYSAEQRLDAARRHLEACERLARRLVQQTPSDVNTQRMLGQASILRTRIEMGDGRWPVALESADDSESMLRRFSAVHPENEQLQLDLAYAIGLKGSCLRKLGLFELAQRSDCERYELLTSLASRFVGNSDFELEVATAEYRLAASYVSLRRFEGYTFADELLGSARQKLRKLAESGEAYRRAREVDNLSNSVEYLQSLVARLRASIGSD